MKKIVALLCILTLLCLPSALAEASFTASAGGARLLTVSYDEAAFRVDTDSYLSSSRGGHTWLAMFYNGGATIELAADRYDDAPADGSRLADYLCAKWNGSLVETSAGPVPFVILSLSGPTGQSYCAAALIQGYVVHFEVFSYGGTEGLGTLRQLLGGVRP